MFVSRYKADAKSVAKVVAAGFCRALLLAAALAPAVAAATSPAPGTVIVNTASMSDSTNTTLMASVSVSVIAETAGTPELDILQYAPAGSPNASQATSVPVSAMACNGQSYIPSYSTFASGTLTTPSSLALFVDNSNAASFTVGEPLFLRVTDADANTNPAVADQVVVVVNDSITGDSESMTLNETGPNTGVFTGYVNTTATKTAKNDCMLSVAAGDMITASFGNNTQQTASMVDPLGVVFDDQSGVAVNNVLVTLVDATSNLPVPVYGDDGTPNFPNPVVTGHQGYKVGLLTYNFGQGQFRFPNVQATGNYKLLVSQLPQGYVAPGQTPVAGSAAAAKNYALDPNASFQKSFALNQGEATTVNIPIDKPTTGLYVTKSAGSSTAAIGDFVPYTVVVTNSNSHTLAGVSLTDHLPPGLRYRAHTLQVNGVTVADPVVSSDGSTFTTSLGDIATDTADTVTYAVEVTAATPLGSATNQARAFTSAAVSNTAQATIVITEDLMRSKAILTGRVWESDTCNDPNQKPVKGVRLYMEDGTYVITDLYGKWHLDNINPGTHVVQLDKASLPKGYELVECEKHTRSAGNSFSQFVDVQGGTLWQVDFHVRRPKPPAPIRLRVDEADQEMSGRMASEMGSDGVMHLTFTVHNPSTDITSGVIHIPLVAGMDTVPGSWKLDGQAMPDPALGDDGTSNETLSAMLQKADGHVVSWDMKLSGHPSAGTRDIHANAVVTTPKGDVVINADNILSIEVPEKVGRVIVFHPHFASYSTDLTDADKKWLADIAKDLSNEGEIRIEVVGHTDNMRVVPRKGRAINDNYALSKARAASVASYLATALKLDSDHISSDGKGPDEPIQDNKTPAGRAANRRVELKVHAVAHAQAPKVALLSNDSGEKTKTLRSWQVVPDDSPVPEETETSTTTDQPAAPAASGDATAGGTATTPATTAEDKSQMGILSLHDGDVLPNRVYPVRVRMDSRLTMVLTLDGKVIPNDQIGFTETEGKTSLSVYIGVDFGEAGQHELTIKGTDPFGIARFTQTFKVVRPGELTRILVTPLPGNVADGKTPVRMKVQFVDGSGKTYTAATDLKVVDGNLVPSLSTALDKSLTDQGPKVAVAADGTVSFAPVSHSGLYAVSLGYNGVISEKTSTYVRPEKRDWIMVGLAEGSMADKTLSGNVEALNAAGENKNIWQDGRVAFFAKGQIKGDWLLTLAYDTAKSTDTQAFGQVIDPTQYYTVYADATSAGYDAPSKAKLYIRMERDAFYMLFGDFSTGLTDTTLSAYNRSFTGFKSEYHDQKYDLNVFAASSDQSFVRRDVRGDGTSGIYHLGDANILPGSDKVWIETRDRLRPDVVLSTQQLSPYADYSLDYLTGELFFRSPVMSQDSNFNPIYIVAEYELQASGNAQINAGGRAAVKLMDGKAVVGVTAVHENDGTNSGNLHGLDTQLKITPVDTIKAEVSQSSSDNASTGQVSGVAHLLQWQRNTKNLVSTVFFNDQGDGFGLGQQSSVSAGLRSYGANERYQVTRFWALIGSLLDQVNLDTNARQRSLSLGAEYKTGKLTTQVGLLNATANFDDGTSQSATQATASARYEVLPGKMTLHANTAVGIHESDNQDFPDMVDFGADYKLTKAVTLNADQQFTWSKDANTSATRAGAVWSPWQGANFGEHLEHDVDESGDRVMSSLGLGQSVKLNHEWTLESTYDRADKLKGSENTTSTASATESVIPSAAPAYGPSTTNFWAAGVGGQYQEQYTKGTLRVEHRVASDDIRWNFVGAVYRELDPQMAIAGGLQITDDDQLSGGTTTDTADVRWSMAWRPDHIRWVLLHRVDLIWQTQKDLTTSLDGQRIVNNLNASRRWDKDQLSVQYGAKYVLSTINSQNLVGFTDLMGGEWRHDIRENWDIGAQASILHSWSAGVINPSYGLSVGFTPTRNAWVSIGYNFEGVSDRDFSDANYTAKGIFLKLRAKFDQDSVQQIWQSARGGVFW